MKSTLLERKIKFLEYLADKSGVEKGSVFRGEGTYYELAKLELESREIASKEITEKNIQDALNIVNERVDCADFVIQPLLRILCKYSDSKILTENLKKDIEKEVLSFKYWIDEPNPTRKHPCYFTENHQILYHSAELLAGQLFPDKIFTNNQKTGKWHIEHATKMILKWMDWRIRFGFSEWNANGYFDVDLIALLNLLDFSENEEIAKKAKGLIDILILEIALNSYHGIFGSTHGRSYVPLVMKTDVESTNGLQALFWEKGSLTKSLSKSAIFICTSKYILPDVIKNIALDDQEPLENKERHSLDVKDAPKHGVFPEKFEDIMFFWGSQVFDNIDVIEHSKKVAKMILSGHHFMRGRIDAFAERYDLCKKAGISCDTDPDYTALTQVDIYTYKTSNYMLSCAQDYRKGKPGYQQHIWQATLGKDAIVYTSHPGGNENVDYSGRPNYWVGNHQMPKAVAYKNTLISMYRINPVMNRTHFTHAYFPQEKFDEVVEKEGWVFGRKGDGYVALYSLNDAEWQKPDPELFNLLNKRDKSDSDIENWKKPYDLVSHGHSNIWICELGSSEDYSDFSNFIKEISSAKIEGDIYNFTYNSPLQGKIQTGWNEQLSVNEKFIPIHNYPRFKNKYIETDFDSKIYKITNKDTQTVLNFNEMDCEK